MRTVNDRRPICVVFEGSTLAIRLDGDNLPFVTSLQWRANHFAFVGIISADEKAGDPLNAIEIFQVNKKNSKPTKPKPTKAKTGAKSSGGGSKAAKSAKKSAEPAIRLISNNRKVRHHYEVLESVECGMILVGSEVKSLRNGKCQLDEAYGRVKGETLWLVGCNIAEYPQATVWNHEPKRPRQLLVTRREMDRFMGKAKEKGLTLVPLRMYFSERGFAKCEMALCKGLKLHDKRDKMKKDDARREIERAVKKRI